MRRQPTLTSKLLGSHLNEEAANAYLSRRSEATANTHLDAARILSTIAGHPGFRVAKGPVHGTEENAALEQQKE
ncbi:hypothetical protein E2562_023098 [Oryza meyeriana var. granulata]|uniref:Uncharacterized protein n=1 Tax=Oryza meyeriana var. granulata TaxID=110450 RepID=A0A6G1E052_9ORYZ|nr:hypothetical protein E2562_023098 [Oryza meyeriana var. granulata]